MSTRKEMKISINEKKKRDPKQERRPVRSRPPKKDHSDTQKKKESFEAKLDAAVTKFERKEKKAERKEMVMPACPFERDTLQVTDFSDIALMCQLFAMRYVQLYSDEFKGIPGNYSATVLSPAELSAYFFLCCMQIAYDKKQLSPLVSNNNTATGALYSNAVMPSLLGDWMVNYLGTPGVEAPILCRTLVFENDWTMLTSGISSTSGSRSFSNLQDNVGIFNNSLSCFNVGPSAAANCLEVYIKYVVNLPWTGLYGGAKPFALQADMANKYIRFVGSANIISTTSVDYFLTAVPTTFSAFCVPSGPIAYNSDVTWLNGTVAIGPNSMFTAAEAIIFQPNYSEKNYPYKGGCYKCLPMTTLYNPTRYNESGTPIVGITVIAQLLQTFTYMGVHVNLIKDIDAKGVGHYMDKYRIFDCKVPKFDRVQQFHLDYTKFMDIAMREFAYHANTGVVSSQPTSDAWDVLYWYYDHVFRARLFDEGCVDLTLSIGAVPNTVTWQNFFSSQTVRNAKVTSLIGLMLEQNGPYVAHGVLFIPSCNMNSGSVHNSFTGSTGFKSGPLLPWGTSNVGGGWLPVGQTIIPNEYPFISANVVSNTGNNYPNLVTGEPSKLISNAQVQPGQPDGVATFPVFAQLSQLWFQSVSALAAIDNANPLINNWFGYAEGISAAYTGYYSLTQINNRGYLFPAPRRGLRGGFIATMTSIDVPAAEYSTGVTASIKSFMCSNDGGIATSNNEILSFVLVLKDITVSHLIKLDYVARPEQAFAASALGLRNQGVLTVGQVFLGFSSYFYNVPSQEALTLKSNLINEFNNIESPIYAQFNKNLQLHKNDYSYKRGVSLARYTPTNCWKNIFNTVVNVVGQSIFSETAASVITPACNATVMLLRTGLKIPVPPPTCSIVSKGYKALRGVYTNATQK